MLKQNSPKNALVKHNAVADEQLEMLLGGKVKKKKFRILPFIITSVVLAAAGAGAWFFMFQQTDESAETVYREYTVARGDITVGNTESSSISLDRESITFPVSTVVDEIYVKTGSYVQEGDPLMKLNIEEINAGLLTYELELEDLKVKLDQAKLNRTKGSLEAKQKKENAKIAGETAEATKQLALIELQQSLSTAQNSLVQAQTDYYDYNEKYYRAWGDLCELNDKFSAQSSTYSAAKAELDNYSGTTVLTYNDGADPKETIWSNADVDALKVEITNYENNTDIRVDDADAADYVRQLKVVQTEIQNRASNASTAESAYTKAKEEYTKAADSFETTYGTTGYYSDYETNIANLQLKVEQAQLALDKANVNYESNAASALQKQETSETDAKLAKTEQEIKENEDQSNVDSAQEAYDTLSKEIAEVRESIGEDGTIYASCTGMVSNIAYKVGDNFEISYDPVTYEVIPRTIITLADISSIYVPITISEEDILNVDIGQTASVTMTAFPNMTFEAEVDTISVESSRSGAATVSYTVNVRYKGTNTLKMLEGMSAEVTLVQWQVQDVLYINASCVSNVGGRAVVLIRDTEGNPIEREVKTGFSDGRYVEIISGLSEGDTVLLESTVKA